MKNLSFLLLLLFNFSVLTAQETSQKNRVIILTDIEADPDDTQSLVRLLLYSNEIDIKGIVATTSCWLKSSIHPESIKKVLQAYAKVQPNLKQHHSDFPEASSLMDVVKTGLPVYGMLGVGEGKDSEGSDWIIKTLEEEDERPLWISVWGGSNTLAQALSKIKNTKTKEEQKRLISKLRVYAISDQDDSSIWIRDNFRDLFYIVTPGDDYGRATWNGINSVISGIDNTEISNSWLAENIQQAHGPLGAVYPDVAYGMEGDTPAFLSLIPNGLNFSEHPNWGGWGGRYEFYKPYFSGRKQGKSGVPFEVETRKIWTNAKDSYTPFVPNEYGRSITSDTLNFTSDKVSLWRWRDDFQNDFAARMDWCLQPYTEANHAPVIVLKHPDRINVESGKSFTFDASDSTDPDGDNLSFVWFSYPEAGTYEEPVYISGAKNLYTANITVPRLREEATLHYILKVTDKGYPALSSYKRIIVTVKP